ncbi:hypothetical protein FIBSPDRAFT_887831 [Athelia psychrophila]|uniref:Uncharacterized protein n=1 Tax=Athelia psychrophila TaxID=1759441 RepID=A0A166P9U0_9AGAM|nr:hypothetical protein FIBSPDRAFT_887831 [Fibularhizoctonia sp. CBS 109695]
MGWQWSFVAGRGERRRVLPGVRAAAGGVVGQRLVGVDVGEGREPARVAHHVDRVAAYVRAPAAHHLRPRALLPRTQPRVALTDQERKLPPIPVPPPRPAALTPPPRLVARAPARPVRRMRGAQTVAQATRPRTRRAQRQQTATVTGVAATLVPRTFAASPSPSPRSQTPALTLTPRTLVPAVPARRTHYVSEPLHYVSEVWNRSCAGAFPRVRMFVSYASEFRRGSQTLDWLCRPVVGHTSVIHRRIISGGRAAPPSRSGAAQRRPSGASGADNVVASIYLRHGVTLPEVVAHGGYIEILQLPVENVPTVLDVLAMLQPGNHVALNISPVRRTARPILPILRGGEVLPTPEI